MKADVPLLHPDIFTEEFGERINDRPSNVAKRFFYEQGTADFPKGGCRGCSFLADQVAHPAHLNARDTTLAFVSRAPQADIARWKARMGWEEIPWYTLTDDFDADFDVAEWHGTNAFLREEPVKFRSTLLPHDGRDLSRHADHDRRRVLHFRVRQP